MRAADCFTISLSPAYAGLATFDLPPAYVGLYAFARIRECGSRLNLGPDWAIPGSDISPLN